MQVISFNYDISVQIIQSEYEKDLEEYSLYNVYYSPEDIVQYFRIRQNPSGYFVQNPDRLFEPTELNPNTLQTTRHAVIALSQLNQTNVINRQATISYIMEHYVHFSTVDGNFSGFSKFPGYPAGVRSTCDAILTLACLQALNISILNLTSIEDFILYHMNPDGGFWDDDYPVYEQKSTLICTSFATRALGNIYQYQGRVFDESLKEKITEFVNSCIDETDNGFANMPNGESEDVYAIFRAFISLWWIGGSNDTERKNYVNETMDLNATIDYLFNNYMTEPRMFSLYEGNVSVNDISIKSTHLMVWFLVDMKRESMLNRTSIGHYLIDSEIKPGQYGEDIYSVYAAVLIFTKLRISTESLPAPIAPEIGSLGYPNILPSLIMAMGVIAIISAYIAQQKATEIEKNERENLEKIVEERTKSLKNEILQHETTQAALMESESSYRKLFEDSPLSLWVEDFSQVKEMFDNLIESGVSDLRNYLQENENELLRCTELVQIIDVNKATLALHGLSRKEEILGPLSNILYKDAIPSFLEQVIALYSGDLSFESEISELLVNDERKTLILQLTIPAGYQDTWRKVFVTIIDITERKKAENEIAASLAEKELLLKEIHHRVKNNLQIVSSLLYLQQSRISDNEVKSLLKESEQRIRSMAMIHEALYKSDDLARVDFEKYIKNLSRYLLSSFKMKSQTIEVKVSIKPKLLNIDTAIPCALIINELVTNSLKYAFPDGKSGEIGISLDAIDDDILELSVYDNGIGFPENYDVFQNDTLGMRLVTSLAEKQLDGSVEQQQRGSTRVVIRFKRK